MSKLFEFKWTTSRAKDTYGYNVCSLWVDGRKVSSCSGGGYDMQGTCLADYIAAQYANRLLDNNEEFYGLSYEDPTFDPGKAVLPDGRTLEEQEASGMSLWLLRCQAWDQATSRKPTERHTVPIIDGGCGFSAVERIIGAIGLRLQHIKRGLYLLEDTQQEAK